MEIQTIQDIKFTLEIVSSVVLMYAAIRALYQLSLIREQNAITRESIAINELREFEKFLQDYDSLNKLIKSRNTGNIIFDISEMKDFDMIESSEDKFKLNMSNWNTFYQKNGDIYSTAINCSNKLEVIATALNKGTAKLEIIEESIASAFCSFVEQHAYLYVRNRNKAISLYKNTVTLYRKFKPTVKTVQEQVALIKEEVDKILERK